MHKGNESLVMHFVREHADLNLLQTRFENGDDCVQIAVRNQSHKLLLFLLEQGVSPNRQNTKTGDTALHTAVQARDLKITSLLCRYEADARITNRNMETPLTLAIDSQDHDLVELLQPETQQVMRNSLVPPKHSTSLAEHYSSDLRELADAVVNSDMLDETYEMPSNSSRMRHLYSEDAAYMSQFDEDEKQKLDAHRIATANPFTKIRRQHTEKVLQHMVALTTAETELPTLEAWLQKKNTRGQWQRRWVVVKGSHMLWSDRQLPLTNPRDKQERDKFSGSVSVMNIAKVALVVKGKTQRKFKVVLGRQTKRKRRTDYVWKCATPGDRNHWVEGIRKHIAQVKMMTNYLGTKT